MLGPTGSGKTLLAQTLAKILIVPFAIAAIAYGAGVFRGCLRQRTFRCYRPVIVRDMS